MSNGADKLPLSITMFVLILTRDP